MALTDDIRDNILNYLAGNSTLREFEDWLVEASWDAHLSDPGGADLAYEVKLLLAEYTSGDRSENDVGRALVPLVRDAWVWTGTPQPIKSSSEPQQRLVVLTVG